MQITLNKTLKNILNLFHFSLPISAMNGKVDTGETYFRIIYLFLDFAPFH